MLEQCFFDSPWQSPNTFPVASILRDISSISRGRLSGVYVLAAGIPGAGVGDGEVVGWEVGAVNGMHGRTCP